MSRFKAFNSTPSVDGYGAGTNQSLDQPLGIGGEALHEGLAATHRFHRMRGGSGGTIGVDNVFAARGLAKVGAWVLGRNRFGPMRGAWPKHQWRGWWREDPRYHCPVFTLTHHARAPLTMAGGTTFQVVTEGIGAALERAKNAAQGKDVRRGGGAATIRQYLQARLVDKWHLAIAPRLPGAGEPLWAGIDLPALGHAVREPVPTPVATQVVLARTT